MVRYINAAVLVGATLQGVFAQGMCILVNQISEAVNRAKTEARKQHKSDMSFDFKVHSHFCREIL
jgi:hypothetical protein